MNEEIEANDEVPFAYDVNAIGSDTDKPADEPAVLQALATELVAEMPARTRSRKVTTLTLSSRTCKWPIGDPAKEDFHYCGLPPQSGRPYCDTHDSMSYQPAPRKKPPSNFR
ncbi:MAG TPA: GcrA family cell cycle regulator [Micropepsaceae bacterium]|jgi:GcrA cell cycle regulator|nr:GcrA family cell cycle regulator [Micropepsaceae bacterium]